MPTYAAKCPKCGKVEEYWSKISEKDAALPTCDKCKVKMEPTMIKAEGGFILKGSGWYGKGGY